VGERPGKVVFMTDSGLTREVAVEVVGRSASSRRWWPTRRSSTSVGWWAGSRRATATVTLTNQGREPLSLIRASLDMGTSVEFQPDLMRQ
jgi:hypothetical protein